MAFVPTRSGKGVGLVVPTLLSWPGSAIIHDIKGENWQITSDWRSRFSRSRLYELIKSGQIETVKVGRSTLVLYRSLKRIAGI
jgi:hypothetical protein